jgi:predicted MFS family arabinose efflux permease
VPSIRAQIGLAVATVMGYISANLAPLLLGAAQDGMALTGGQAGLLTTLEFVAFGACAVALSPWLPRMPKRRVVVAGALVAAASHVFAALAPSYALVAVARALAGAGHGTVVSTAFAVVASLPESERIYARCYGTVLVLAAAAYFAIPPGVDAAGYRGAYALVALFLVVLLPVVGWMPRGVRSRAASSAATPDDPRAIDRPALSRPPAAALLALVAAVLVAFSDGLAWTMTERIGVSLGIESRRISLILGPSLVTGLVGTVVADRLGTRRGLRGPLLIGVWATAVAGLVITTSGGEGHYITGAVLKNVTMFFLLPYMLGTAAALDPQGRAAGATGGIIPMGYGLGPYAAGLIADRWGFAVIGLVGLGVVAVATVVYVRVFAMARQGGDALVRR